MLGQVNSERYFNFSTVITAGDTKLLVSVQNLFENFKIFYIRKKNIAKVWCVKMKELITLVMWCIYLQIVQGTDSVTSKSLH